MGGLRASAREALSCGLLGVCAGMVSGKGLEQVGCGPGPAQEEAPGILLGIIRLLFFAEAMAQASSLIRLIIFFTGWMCSSRSRPFGELI